MRKHRLSPSGLGYARSTHHKPWTAAGWAKTASTGPPSPTEAESPNLPKQSSQPPVTVLNHMSPECVTSRTGPGPWGDSDSGMNTMVSAQGRSTVAVEIAATIVQYFPTTHGASHRCIPWNRSDHLGHPPVTLLLSTRWFVGGVVEPQCIDREFSDVLAASSMVSCPCIGLVGKWPARNVS